MSKTVIRIVAAVIEHDGRYLITQRNATAVMPLLWEFPGGRVEPAESDEDALIREVRGRIGVEVVVIDKMAEQDHSYARYDVHLTMFRCRLEDGRHPRPVNVNDLRWVTTSELRDYEFPPADEKTMDKLLGFMSN
ncbi:MAG: (deoxy)nucleoside triphosphate pyrophosphohydrolase [Myxococcota bacterium]